MVKIITVNTLSRTHDILFACDVPFYLWLQLFSTHKIHSSNNNNDTKNSTANSNVNSKQNKIKTEKKRSTHKMKWKIAIHTMYFDRVCTESDSFNSNKKQDQKYLHVCKFANIPFLSRFISCIARYQSVFFCNKLYAHLHRFFGGLVCNNSNSTKKKLNGLTDKTRSMHHFYAYVHFGLIVSIL